MLADKRYPFDCFACRAHASWQILRELRSKARALINFIGMNQVVIGADVNAKLVHLEALMS